MAERGGRDAHGKSDDQKRRLTEAITREVVDALDYGVFNVERADLDNILEHGTVKPVVNQVLAHVGNTPFDLIDYCREQGVLVET